MRARLRAVTAASLLLAGLPACAHHYRYRFPPAMSPPVGSVQEGMASWYGPGYHGKPTSSGERYDQDDLTAAHERWAFGTLVRVTALASGRSVVVRINDRFPNHKGRVIDLSRAAAKSIGLIGPGTGQVRLEVVGRESLTGRRTRERP